MSELLPRSLKASNDRSPIRHIHSLQYYTPQYRRKIWAVLVREQIWCGRNYFKFYAVHGHEQGGTGAEITDGSNFEEDWRDFHTRSEVAISISINYLSSRSSCASNVLSASRSVCICTGAH
jgi:hypothetical protein